MNARKTIVASLFLALAAFFAGAGEAQAQYRQTGPNKLYNQTYQSTFNKTPPPIYTWKNGNGETRTSRSQYYNPNHFLPTFNPTKDQVFKLQRR